MVSASLEESRISSPIATVICVERLLVVEGERLEEGRGIDIFEHLDLGTYAFDFGVVLVFEFGEDGVAVLTSVWVGTPVSFRIDQ